MKRIKKIRRVVWVPPIRLTIALIVVIAVSLQSILSAHLWNVQSSQQPKAKQQPEHHRSTLHEQSSHTSKLPIWIQNYVQWHKEQRQLFPGEALFTHPDAPKLLIRTCLGLCGGLNDRLGQLPWDLYLANQTKRLLLLHWHRPVPLEHFLLPKEMDWTVPPTGVSGFFSKTNVRVSRQDMKIVRNYTELFENYSEDRPKEIFWETQLDASIERANTGVFKDTKVLRHRLLGHLAEDQLELRLKQLGETDMIHNTASFGHIFWMFFSLSDPVQTELDKVYKDLKLTPHAYNGVHCRVRHPKSAPRHTDMRGKNFEYTADKAGLPWTGATREFAIHTATRAIQCANHHFAKLPIYFFSDSNDLVHYMTKELNDPQFVAQNASSNVVDDTALRTVQQNTVVGREMSLENAHIDKQKGRDPFAYYMTFVDLMLAINAQCLSYGVGFYAVFASKISGSCKLLYQQEHWGGSSSKTKNVEQCKLPL